MKIARLITLENQKPQINLSVRALVEFLLRQGDIDDSKGKVDPFEAMQEGSRIHKKIQKAMGPFYHPEVFLKHQREYEDYVLGIEGRADGVVYTEDEDGVVTGALVDEIKGMYMDVNVLTGPILVHEAQAKCYAYMISEEYNLSEIEVQLTYCNLDTEEIKRFTKTYSFEDISTWFNAMIDIFNKWSDLQYYGRLERNDSIINLKFPFEYRKGQKKITTDVYKSILRNKTLFIQAPTGTGKTITTVFPAVMALGQNLADRVFYLTAKTSTALGARDTLKLLADQGYEGKTIMLTAKDKMCMLDERSCTPEDCPYARGHFDRINDAVFELVTKENIIVRETIRNYASEYVVCPFELALDASTWCDQIICDYNYVFDPNVYLKRFFAEGRNGEHIFLIDEAHNMVDRAREMYSQTIVKEEVLSIKKYAKTVDKKLVNALERVNKLLLEIKRQCTGELVQIFDIDQLLAACDNLQIIFEKLFKKEVKFGVYQQEVVDFYFKLRNFTSIAYELDFNHYKIYGDFDEDKNFRLTLYCIDPSAQLQQRINFARSSVYFSATLLPINYYKDLLCNDDEVYAIYAESIFDIKNRMILLGTDVTSKYTRRDSGEYEKYADYISKIVEAKQGNYMVFGPSYRFIEEVMKCYTNKYAVLCDDNPFTEETATSEVIIQKSNMTEVEREDFLLEFDKIRDKSLVAFCTMGGIFSEGIDLVGGKLIGVIVMGAGLPQIGSERKMMQDFFDEQDKNGFEYAYLYPGMNKVIQAAGRLIRTSEDVGVIALLDERFRFSSYKKNFPREWADAKECNLSNVSLYLTNFWAEK